ncbi:hypothetical protein THYS13_12930 [Thermoanaerobacter sp. YS13]|nr:hypothetical protein THYS13_12930 [Thermoanaerobacter sp. YS13]
MRDVNEVYKYTIIFRNVSRLTLKSFIGLVIEGRNLRKAGSKPVFFIGFLSIVGVGIFSECLPLILFLILLQQAFRINALFFYIHNHIQKVSLKHRNFSSVFLIVHVKTVDTVHKKI